MYIGLYIILVVLFICYLNRIFNTIHIVVKHDYDFSIDYNHDSVPSIWTFTL